MSRSAEVDAYISALSPERAAALGAVREAVHGAFPDIAERIEWKMPVYARVDRWIATASQKSYVSLYLRSVTIAERLAATDKRLKHGKGCLNIRDGVALPLTEFTAALPELLG